MTLGEDYKQEASWLALATHDALKATGDREPDSEREPDAWLAWHSDEYKPAYETWSKAMGDLEKIGYSGGRHPMSFRPWCEQHLQQEGKT